MPVADMMVVVQAPVVNLILGSNPTDVITPRAVPPNQVTSQQQEPHIDNRWQEFVEPEQLGHF